MANGRTVGEVLERVRDRRRSQRCPTCDSTVTIRGYHGEYRWSCLDCDAVGFGYRSRSEAIDGARSR
ncbi:hypothetical protein [Halovivax ruber]|uniref:hypothetical protein n=1 Tax=Halovivax ruber TaxID=387341 RepID=UPI0011E55643|nr:hypothetical protein [Halovivax ruber]